MCGRYLITSSLEAFRRLFGYLEQPNFPPRYNVAPTQPIPVVRIVEGRRQFALVRWGLIPPWVKDPRKFTLLINARAESVNDKPAFRYPMRRRRCLVPADGFYEWKDEGGRKRPFCVRPRDGEPIAFAGLWETWIGPNGEELETAAIITTNASRTSRSCTIACRWSCRPARSISGWIAVTSTLRPRPRCWLPPPKDCWTPTRFRPRSIARRTMSRP